MPANEIVDRICELGVDREQAEVYVRLRVRGPSRASHLAKELRTSRPKMYRLLDALIQRGDAVADATRPIQYRAIPPQQLFDRIAAEAQRTRDEAIRAKRDVADELERLASPANQTPTTGSFRIIQERKELLRTIERQASSATDEILFVSLDPNGDLAAGGPRDILGRLIQNHGSNVRVRVILHDGFDASTRLAQAAGNPSQQVRTSTRSHPFRFIIVDDSEYIGALAPRSNETPEDPFIWSDAKGLVATHHRLFQSLWEDGLPFDPGRPRRPAVGARDVVGQKGFERNAETRSGSP